MTIWVSADNCSGKRVRHLTNVSLSLPGNYLNGRGLPYTPKLLRNKDVLCNVDAFTRLKLQSSRRRDLYSDEPDALPSAASDEAHFKMDFSRNRRKRREETSSVRDENDEVETWMKRIRASDPDVRSAALEQLLRIDQQGAFIGLASRVRPVDIGLPIDTDENDLDEAVNSSNLSNTKRFLLIEELQDPRHRQRVTEIVAGSVRWQRRLQFVIENLGELPRKPNLRKMDPPLRLIILSAAYELLELGLPPHAINEWVELAKRVGHKGWASVSNKLLRALQRARDEKSVPKLPSPSRGDSLDQMADKIALASSHPTWLVSRWIGKWGPKETFAMVSANNRRPSHGIRVASDIDLDVYCNELQKSGIEVGQSKYLPDEFMVVESGHLQKVLRKLKGLDERAIEQVQDEAAGLVVAVLDPRPGESILDCCAAPGGKALFAASRMQGEGSIVALDVSDRRLKALQKSAMKQGYTQNFLRIIAIDAIQHCHNAKMSGQLYDRVLVDAPCSGTGVLAKRADLRWRRTPGDIEELKKLQQSLLEASSAVVKPGGILVYSTCSLESDENEEMVSSFLIKHPEYQMETLENLIPADCIGKDGAMQMLPHRHGTDGAFAARFRKSM